MEDAWKRDERCVARLRWRVDCMTQPCDDRSFAKQPRGIYMFSKTHFLHKKLFRAWCDTSFILFKF